MSVLSSYPKPVITLKVKFLNKNISRELNGKDNGRLIDEHY